MAQGGRNNQPIWFFIGLATELGFLIAIPLVIAVVAGHYIDEQLGTKVIFTIVGMSLALAVSTYSIYKKIKQIQD